MTSKEDYTTKLQGLRQVSQKLNSIVRDPLSPHPILPMKGEKVHWNDSDSDSSDSVQIKNPPSKQIPIGIPKKASTGNGQAKAIPVKIKTPVVNVVKVASPTKFPSPTNSPDTSTNPIFVRHPPVKPAAAKVKASHRVKWSDKEDYALKKGLLLFGKHQELNREPTFKWKEILEYFKDDFNEKRTNVSLKDRFVTLSKSGVLDDDGNCLKKEDQDRLESDAAFQELLRNTLGQTKSDSPSKDSNHEIDEEIEEIEEIEDSEVEEEEEEEESNEEDESDEESSIEATADAPKADSIGARLRAKRDLESPKEQNPSPKRRKKMTDVKALTQVWSHH
jgi:hypothetical protein